MDLDLLDDITEVCKLLDKIDQCEENLNNSLSRYDLMTCDLLHKIENDELNTKLCWGVIKELKKVRIERRKVKNNREILRVYKDLQTKMLKQENRQLLLADLNKTKKRGNCKYKNRIYTDNFDEIFKKEDVK